MTYKGNSVFSRMGGTVVRPEHAQLGVTAQNIRRALQCILVLMNVSYAA
jgi:hypothetical protein